MPLENWKKCTSLFWLLNYKRKFYHFSFVLVNSSLHKRKVVPDIQELGWHHQLGLGFLLNISHFKKTPTSAKASCVHVDQDKKWEHSLIFPEHRQKQEYFQPTKMTKSCPVGATWVTAASSPITALPSLVFPPFR